MELILISGLSISCFGFGYWFARMHLTNRWPSSAEDHYRNLFERQLHDTERYKAVLFDAQKTMKGQTKGLQRHQRRLKRLLADVEHWQSNYQSAQMEIIRLTAKLAGH